jgi:hypothetical protein
MNFNPRMIGYLSAVLVGAPFILFVIFFVRAERTPVAPLYFTVMTHMEGNFVDDVNPEVFRFHNQQIEYGMGLFDEYDAKLTIESEKPYARANIRWDRNMMQEIVDAGHGVGTHCDIGAFLDEMPLDEYTALFVENKMLVDALVGEDQNRGCSGGNGANDFVTAAHDAGFDYLAGMVGFAYLAFDLDQRPEGWTDEYIRAVTYHDVVPIDLVDRMHLFELADLEDLEPDEEGVIVVNGGGLGEISSMEEGRSNCFPDCVLTTEDADEIFRLIDEALELRDPARVAKLNIHIPVKTYQAQNEEVLRYFLEGMSAYVERGDIAWATQLEVLEAYEELGF